MSKLNLKSLLKKSTDKSNFKSLDDFFNFANEYLEFIETGLQAQIIAQNETNYTFFQYKKDGQYNISRPINSDLFLTINKYQKAISKIKTLLKSKDKIKGANKTNRDFLKKCIYTTQQTVGACLDALPVGESNKARKLVGDYFELFICLFINKMGFKCSSGWVEIPIKKSGKTLFKMKYQHDLLIKKDTSLKVIGSVKTSSKDRIDKIFIDKFLYSKLTGTYIPHIAVFLNDVQRKKIKSKRKYGINSTFLSGHFKGYTIKLNPLDGVYYCDIRPNMVSENFLKKYIKTIDYFFCEDLWKLTK
ncbi:MAG: hypothetical protein OXH36_03585 [Bdellovibrionales bacterium]|nr:hypothetical protein [Bdellovibrionales bacterium]